MNESAYDLIFLALLIFGFLGFVWIAIALPMRIRAKQVQTLTALIKDILNSPNLTKEDKDEAISKITKAITSSKEKD